MDCYLGIDTGKRGALCLLEGGVPRWWSMPKRGRDVDVAKLSRILFGLPRLRLGVVERPPRSMGRAGTFAQWDAGRHWGQVETLMVVSRHEWREATPTQWQSWMGVSLPRGFKLPTGEKPSREQRRAELERRVLARVRELYPGVSLVPPGGRVPSVDRAVSLLLAELARRRG